MNVLVFASTMKNGRIGLHDMIVHPVRQEKKFWAKVIDCLTLIIPDEKKRNVVLVDLAAKGAADYQIPNVDGANGHIIFNVKASDDDASVPPMH